MSFDAFDISASGLHAQRIKMDAISSNIANVNTTRDENGNKVPYAKKTVVFSQVYNSKLGQTPDFPSGKVSPAFDNSSGNMLLKGNVSFDNGSIANGVEVSEINEDKENFKMVYEPGHPDADQNGFVKMPNINIVTEMVDMMTASRSYEANVSAIEATKGMISTAMKI